MVEEEVVDGRKGDGGKDGGGKERYWREGWWREGKAAAHEDVLVTAGDGW